MMAAEVEDVLCGSCENAFKKTEKALKCSGNCNKWFHQGCSNVSNDQFKRLSTKKNGLKWFCEECECSVLISKQGNVEPDKNRNVKPTRITEETSKPMQTSTYNMIVNTNDDTEAYQTARREIMKDQEPAFMTTALIINDDNENSDTNSSIMYGIQADDSFNMLCLSPNLQEGSACPNYLRGTASNAEMTNTQIESPFSFKLTTIPAAAALLRDRSQPAGHTKSSHKTRESFFNFGSTPTGTSGPSNMFQLF